MNPKASCGVLYPPLCGIVQLTNFPTLRYGNWSFTNKSTNLKNLIYSKDYTIFSNLSY
ncbi:MAG: hypothetical protein IMZ63_01210 [Actinobacteria bacterium]|nr:hypothetical protein [Actinomycetota bacterium]